ncbi:unnamed protein product [Diplocarpon coronariae]
MSRRSTCVVKVCTKGGDVGGTRPPIPSLCLQLTASHGLRSVENRRYVQQRAESSLYWEDSPSAHDLGFYLSKACQQLGLGRKPVDISRLCIGGEGPTSSEGFHHLTSVRSNNPSCRTSSCPADTTGRNPLISSS